MYDANKTQKIVTGRVELSMPKNTDTSGGTRFSEGKPKFYCFPVMGLNEVARVAERGAEKYAPFDYRQGQNYSTLVNSAFRHMVALVYGGPKARDPETGLLHAAHAAWNLLALCGFLEEGRDDLDDITPVMDMNTAEYKEYIREDQ